MRLNGSYWSTLFPAYLAFGVGISMSLVALQIAAFRGVDTSVSGLAGGMLDTAREVGGAIGVAVVATLAISRADDILADGGAPGVAMAEGYQRASLITALLSAVAAIVAGTLLRRAEHPGDGVEQSDVRQLEVADA